ncbi:MAG TPA: PAS domain S-box protein [Methanoregulaceae archaeon]|nr:PAS domain S-box protein [Methanoregulaceae archaeon]
MTHILFVDDEPGILEVTKEYLEHEGSFEVDTADSARSAFEKLKNTSYEAIISDYQMPGTDGIEFLKQVRKSDKAIPFIIFTGRSREEVVIEALNEGADFYLQKGGDPKAQFAELTHKIRRAIEHRSTERDFQESEARFRVLIQNSSDIIHVVSADGLIRYASPSSEKILGYEEPSMIGKSPLEFVNPEDQAIVKEALWQVQEKRNPGTPTEFRVRKANGDYIFVESIAVNLIGVPPIDAIVITTRLIGERKRIEFELRENLQKYRNIIETSPDIIWEIDTSGNFTYISPRIEKITGYHPSEIIGKSIFSFVQKDAVATVASRLDQHGTGSEWLSCFEVPAEHRDGRHITIEIHSAPFFNTEGVLTGFRGIAHDITRRKEVKKALEESEENFRTFFNMAGDAIAIHDLHGRFLEVNDEICRRLGYSREELLEMGPFDIDEPEYSKLIPARVQELQQTGHIVFETIHRAKDGTRILTEVNSCMVMIRGAPAILSTGRDITERKRMEESLRITRDKYAKLFLGSPDAIMISDLETGVFIEVNDATSDIFGYSRDEMIGKSETELGIWPRKEERDAFLHRINTTGWVRRFEVTGCRDNGNLFWASVSADIIHIAGRMCIIRVVRDITEDKRNEDFLKEREATIRVLMNSPVDLMLLLDPGGTILEMNSSMAKRMGWDQNNLIGRCVYDLLPPDTADIRRAYAENVVQTKKPVRWEDQHGGKWLDNSVHPIFDAAGNVTKMAVIARDITRQKNIEQVLQQVNRQLRLLSSITRHDILNKITAIQGYLSLVKTGLASPETANYLENIESSVTEIRSHIEFTRIYQDIGAHEPQWLDPDTIMSCLHVPPGITLKTDMNGVLIFSNPMIEKVFSNLLDNSVRHGERVNEIRVSDYPSGEDLIVVWEDNGIGVNDHEKERIFEYGHGKNTGHGMFLAREILSLTGITIREVGTPGRGARFEITVPKGNWRKSDTK